MSEARKPLPSNPPRPKPQPDTGLPYPLGKADIDAVWQELLDKSDRTSPAEYPDMALITFDEFREAIAALSRATEAVAEPVAWRYRTKPSHGHDYGRWFVVEGGEIPFRSEAYELQPLYASPPAPQPALALIKRFRTGE